MIRHLTGRVIDASPTSVVLDVAGVGYLVYTTNPGTNFARDCDVSLWIYQAVRETALDLYGFTTRDELEIFELLLTLPKVGPKSAAGILAQADIELLKKAVLENDASYLSKMSGIGKKTAEKIVLELKDKFADLGGFEAGAEGAGQSTDNAMISDTIDALVSLGYPQADARKVVQQLPPDIENANDAVRAALKVLSS